MFGKNATNSPLAAYERRVRDFGSRSPTARRPKKLARTTFHGRHSPNCAGKKRDQPWPWPLNTVLVLGNSREQGFFYMGVEQK